jgi:hypothetical protein
MSGAVLGSLALFLEGVVFFMLQEPNLVPKALLRMVDTTKNDKPSRLRRYITMTFKLWWEKHIAGPIIGAISVMSAIATVVWWNDPTLLARIARWTAGATGCATAVLIFAAQYDAWRTTDEELEKEKAKNEARPTMDIGVLNVVPRGSLGAGLTDLFFYLDLVLGTPSQVSIRDFSLMIFNDAQSLEIVAVEDVLEWQLLKSVEDALRSFVPCLPLTKELTRPGDSVQGWIHFPLPNVPERSIQMSGLKIKVNCQHGTCYHNLAGAYVISDPVAKGSMRKITTS